MKTITFYSYKGGVGRSLALANIAYFLAMHLDKNVVALDLDIEAPGLHYKFCTDSSQDRIDVKSGIVEYMDLWAESKVLPPYLDDNMLHNIDIKEGKGKITLIPAGDPCRLNYWGQVNKLNWHEHLHSETGEGFSLFIDLKDKIEKQLSPDFLLIDSRTGVTELGGISTTILPDIVVCFFTYNQESLDGFFQVCNAVKQCGKTVIPVLARSACIDNQYDDDVIEEIVGKHKKASIAEFPLDFKDIIILHADKKLELKEYIHVDNETVDESWLLRDYIYLCSKLIGKSPAITNGGQAERLYDEYTKRRASFRSIIESAYSFSKIPRRLYDIFLREGWKQSPKDDEIVPLAEVEAWEMASFGRRSFWIVLPEFLAEHHEKFVDAMVQNLKDKSIQYLYFLSNEDDILKLKSVTQKVNDKIDDDVSDRIRYLYMEDKLSRAFLRHMNYWIDVSSDSANTTSISSRGYEVWFDKGRPIGGIPLGSEMVDNVIELIKIMVGGNLLGKSTK